MGAALTDEIAARVMGEIHALTTRIDSLVLELQNTAAVTEASAQAMLKNTRQLLIEAAEAAKALHQDNTLPIIDRLKELLKDQINALNNRAGAVTKAAEDIRKDTRQALHDARAAASVVVEEGKEKAAAALQEEVKLVLESVTNKNKAQALAIGAGMALIVVLVAAISGYWVGHHAGDADGYAKAREESAAAAWGNTPNGKLAYSLAQRGSLDDLVRLADSGKMQAVLLCMKK